ncbi:MAG: CRISPR-associated endonuclease Cas3'' [Clostridiales bacterium]|nr:CRISPR-associated endonuclease Cas3'' [Clostridiales bacterium]
MKKDEYTAHRAEDGRIQTAKAHLEGTAHYAAQALAPVGLSQSARLAGLLHDCGKLTQAYQTYLTRAVRGEPVHRGSVNHTFAGVRLLLERYHHQSSGELTNADVACEVLALAVGGHHGWFDCVDEHQNSGFRHRLTKADIGYEDAKKNYFRLVMPPAELDRLFETASAELCPALAGRREAPEVPLEGKRICDMTGDNVPDAQYNAETSFYAGLLARLMLSAVVEGDRRDTAEFMQGVSFAPRRTDEELHALWTECLQRVERKLEELPHISEIDRAKREISDRCRTAASLPTSVFRLNAPTGGGKTPSSLRFVLGAQPKPSDSGFGWERSRSRNGRAFGFSRKRGIWSLRRRGPVHRQTPHPVCLSLADHFGPERQSHPGLHSGRPTDFGAPLQFGAAGRGAAPEVPLDGRGDPF